MELYVRVRRACMVEGMSTREAARVFVRGGLVCLNSAARFDKWNRAARYPQKVCKRSGGVPSL